MNQNENVAQQDSNTSDMIFRCEEIVSWASRDATLLPGTVIMTGTAEGIGAARDPPVYMGPVSSTIPITFSPGKNCILFHHDPMRKGSWVLSAPRVVLMLPGVMRALHFRLKYEFGFEIETELISQGDTVEVEVEKIGVLRNTVVQAP